MRLLKEEEVMYREYADQVMRYLMCLTGNYDLSEELTQETFYQAYKSIGRYDGSCKLSVWLCQIAKHLYYDSLKKQKHAAPVNFEDAAEKCTDGASLEENFIIYEEALAVRKAIHRLREPYREVLMLRLYGGLSFREIGEISDGKSENWARITFYRGKMQIKEELNDDENSM